MVEFCKKKNNKNNHTSWLYRQLLYRNNTHFIRQSTQIGFVTELTQWISIKDLTPLLNLAVKKNSVSIPYSYETMYLILSKIQFRILKTQLKLN